MSLPQPWDAYARVQDQLDHRHIADDYAWGLEAALNKLLDGLPFQNIDRYVDSGSRKERHRARLRRIYLSIPETRVGVERAVYARDLLRTLLQLVSASDRAILRMIAEGFDFREIANARRSTAGAVRTRFCRLRRALKAAASSMS